MHHAVALAASLASFGLICTIYYCNILARPSSWLRSEMLAMVLLSLLTGLFPLAVTAAIAGLWQALTGGVSVFALVSAGADLIAVAAILASIWLFRRLVKETYRDRVGPDNVTPLSPAPVHRYDAPSHRIAA
tara:strand:+ start:510 stop:905 length:396 start_codon:yes stop_codon:yes gene_type:complete